MKNIAAIIYHFLKSSCVFMCVLALGHLPAAAQDAVATQPNIETGEDQLSRFMLYTLLGIMVAVLLYFISTVNSLLKAVIESQMAQAKATSPEAVAKLQELANRPSAWKKFMQKMTAAKPVEQEHDILLDHDYDGIKELDNHLPPWWKYGFYLTIVLGVFYLVNYHMVPIIGKGLSQTAEYEAQNAEAEIQLAEYRKKAADLVDENNVILITDADALGKAKSKFIEMCSACHGEAGQGGIGPNLTDQFWLHGGDIKSVFTTIKYGVADKGMISWKDQIKPSEMQAVASYVLSLQGSNPAGAKEPQGELFVPAADSTQTDSLKIDTKVTAKL